MTETIAQLLIDTRVSMQPVGVGEATHIQKRSLAKNEFPVCRSSDNNNKQMPNYKNVLSLLTSAEMSLESLRAHVGIQAWPPAGAEMGMQKHFFF